MFNGKTQYHGSFSNSYVKLPEGTPQRWVSKWLSAAQQTSRQVLGADTHNSSIVVQLHVLMVNWLVLEPTPLINMSSSVGMAFPTVSGKISQSCSSHHQPISFWMTQLGPQKKSNWGHPRTFTDHHRAPKRPARSFICTSRSWIADKGTSEISESRGTHMISSILVGLSMKSTIHVGDPHFRKPPIWPSYGIYFLRPSVTTL